MATQLTASQLRDLRHDLTSLGRITYAHLADELLDHYAAMTEERIATGQSFYEASTAAFDAMGNGIGIQRIQERYERMTRHQIMTRHIELSRSYLRWPTVVTTLLTVMLLAYLLLAALPTHSAKLLAGVLVLSPAFVVLVACVSHYRQDDSRQAIVWRFIKGQISWPIIFLNLVNVANTGVSHAFSPIVHVGFMLFVTVVSLFQTISLAQLTRETFYYKPVFQR